MCFIQNGRSFENVKKDFCSIVDQTPTLSRDTQYNLVLSLCGIDLLVINVELLLSGSLVLSFIENDCRIYVCSCNR